MELMEMPELGHLGAGGEVLVLRGFLPAVECEAWIGRAERLGFRAGPGPHLVVGGSACERICRSIVCLSDPKIARSLFQNVRDHLPASWPPDQTERTVEGAHPRIRFYRDGPADSVPIHQDDPSVSIDGGASAYTMMVFLSECSGGSIRFHRKADRSEPIADLAPEAGTAMIFPHTIWHEPTPVLAGRRYMVRADLMDHPG